MNKLSLTYFCLFVVSGEVPLNPVISSKSGHLFERRLIEKYIAQEGKCPVTQVPLSETDLIPIQGNELVQ